MKKIFFPGCENKTPNAKLEAYVSKTKGLEGFAWIEIGIVVKKAFKDWNAFSISTPHEKGWSLRIKQVKEVTIVE